MPHHLRGLLYLPRRPCLQRFPPHTAHFVYEILQNADDAGASEIDFVLGPTELIVEHNGKAFDERDVRAISYFGKGKTDVTAIGRFGLGFKSVFAYTATLGLPALVLLFLLSRRQQLSPAPGG